ncbi:LAGLIDADG family homing endonuclease [Fredinandcohnia onubensis]|uniref:LAGLIDADG family homing endonuclease n=1 Tax=Fredinandcohnia onubensis TaxID=1571209 RepID=UPI000C0BD10E|nr:LAGLIDADG family homing endonuclease [Fredinandcohnia onubensis]
MPNENTYIRTDQGLIKLKDLKAGNLIVQKNGYEIYESIDDIKINCLQGGKASALPLSYICVKYNEQKLEAITNTSRKLSLGEKENILTINDNLDFCLSNVEIGLTVPRVRRCCSSYSLSLINLPDLKESKYLFKDFLPLDGDLGYLFSVYIGDGWISGDRVCLASESSYIPDRIKDIINKYIINDMTLHISKVVAPHTFNEKESYCEKHTWSSKRFSALLGSNIGKGAYFKRLPPFWSTTPVDFRWGLISGLIDTDGSIAYNLEKGQTIVNYTTVSKDLANEIICLSHSLDLTGTITDTVTPKGRPCYVITFSQESIYKMKDKLMLTHPIKNHRLNSYIPNSGFKRNKYTPRLSIFRLAELRKSIGARRVRNRSGAFMTNDDDELTELKKRRSLYQVVYRIEKSGWILTRQTALEIINLNLPILLTPFWRKWVLLVENDEIEWEVISEVNSYSKANTIELLTCDLSPVLFDSGISTGIPLVESKITNKMKSSPIF